MRGLLTKVFGDPNERELKRLRSEVEEINSLEPLIQSLSDDQLRAKTEEFKRRLAAGETLDDLLPEAFAVVREAARRTIGMRHFDVQLMAGIVLHEGKIAEMKTGEGKTLVATLPLYLNALEGKGVHLVTVNDYLAKVGAGWMGPIYHFLGLSVGFIAHDQSALFDPDYIDPNANPEDQRLVHWRPCTRREAYLADITYGTNNEFGFDYLRDNMAYEKSQLVQRELHYAIVDEVDNILIDEARTPLIISGPAQKSSDLYRQMAQLVRQLRRSSVSAKQVKEEGLEPDGDFFIDERTKSIYLSEKGIEKLERLLRIPPGESLFDPEHYEKMHYIENALKAQFIYQRDRDYMVTPNGEVVIIDEFTGRAMPGRRWSDGLHQAIEAKEGVAIKNENVTLATITFQNYFRMYKKLAGMTGTAYTEREEFAKIYNLEVVVIPTHKPMIREDLPDQIYATEEAKFKAVLREVQEMHELGRPVLIGTTSVETSERLSAMLKQAGIPHNVLNAKHHEREAAIIAQAGRKGAVTVATNMAGRGTDILLGGNPDGLLEEFLRKEGLTLETATPEQKRAAWEKARAQTEAEGEEVRRLGGLHVIGTERHEARRIDNQLRGRAGRQGDPGSSRFFLSLEDELLRRFGPVDRIKRLMERFVDSDVPLQAGLLDRTIESAQTRVEGYNFDVRKHTVEFDDVMNKQRQIIYADRRAILDEADMRERVLDLIAEEIQRQIDDHLVEGFGEAELTDLLRAYRRINPTLPPSVTAETLKGKTKEEIEQYLLDHLETTYAEREKAVTPDVMRTIERRVMLGAIDRQWVDYLTAMDELRQNILLQAYAQRDPLVEFKRESFRMFDELKQNIARDIVHNIIPATFQYEAYLRQIAEEQARRLATARTSGNGSAETSRKPQRRTTPQIGRNDPCPCGSGKKFKHCHLGREQELAALLNSESVARPSQVVRATRSTVAEEATRIRDAIESGQLPSTKTTPRGRQSPAVPRGKKR